MDNRSIAELLLDPALYESSIGQRATETAVFETGRQSANSQALRPDFPDGDILKDHEIAVERAQAWIGMARFGFNAMLVSPEYKNKLRLKPERMGRIIHFLTSPDAKSREKDRADAQAKHQAKRWTYVDGILYRRESPVRQPRRHVSGDDAFDILTAEHLRSDHHGRDKMLKVLEAKYIGYTKEEVMYVLDHCQGCSSKFLRGAAGRRRETKHADSAQKNEMTSTMLTESD